MFSGAAFGAVVSLSLVFEASTNRAEAIREC